MKELLLVSVLVVLVWEGGRRLFNRRMTQSKIEHLYEVFEAVKKSMRGGKLTDPKLFESLSAMAEAGCYHEAAARFSGDNLPTKKTWTEVEFQGEVRALVHCFEGAYEHNWGVRNALEVIEMLSKEVKP